MRASQVDPHMLDVIAAVEDMEKSPDLEKESIGEDKAQKKTTV
jgi:hypothetical protein